MSALEVRVPDIGDFKDVPVIEIFVKAGDKVNAEDSLVSLESDKATMDVPSPAAGTISAIRIKLGDKVSEGSVIVTMDTDAGGEAAGGSVAKPPPAAASAKPPSAPPAEIPAAPSPANPGSALPAPDAGSTTEIAVPDIGDFHDIPVIEIFVKPGDTVKPEDPLVSLESDKATMDVPSPSAGVIAEVKVKLGDKVSQGTVIMTLLSAGAPTGAATAGGKSNGAAPAAAATPSAQVAPSPARQGEASPRAQKDAPDSIRTGDSSKPAELDEAGFRKAHASPSVRAFARELGVDLAKITGTGPKDRVLQQDVQAYVKQAMTRRETGPAPSSGPSNAGGLDLLPWPKVDFAKFGPVESKPLSRIKKISGANLHRNWVLIPHVTNHDDADITELEAFRVQLNKENEKSGVKTTMLVFLIKACVAALKRFPNFNASLDGDNLVFKQYYNIGFAADTPNGLVVPVIKNADQKGVLAIAKEMSELSSKAREGKLGPTDMQGGCFSISSLGGIGGTYFSPIINAPEVAILGVCRSSMRPVWDGKAFAPRLMLPLSLSYDHRVIDGATAARFNSFLIALLGDMRRTML